MEQWNMLHKWYIFNYQIFTFTSSGGLSLHSSRIRTTQIVLMWHPQPCQSFLGEQALGSTLVFLFFQLDSVWAYLHMYVDS